MGVIGRGQLREQIARRQFRIAGPEGRPAGRGTLGRGQLQILHRIARLKAVGRQQPHQRLQRGQVKILRHVQHRRQPAGLCHDQRKAPPRPVARGHHRAAQGYLAGQRRADPETQRGGCVETGLPVRSGPLAPGAQIGLGPIGKAAPMLAQPGRDEIAKAGVLSVKSRGAL